MTIHDQEKFTQGLMVLAEVYNRKLSALLLHTYWNCLKKYSYVEFEKTLWDFLNNPHYARRNFPSPADWVKAIEGDSETKSLAAWIEVITAIRQVGQYESVKFTEPMIHEVIQDMGGWIFLCQQPERELIFLQKEFERRYRNNCVLKKLTKGPLYLTGQIEHQNSLNGFTSYIPRPRNIKQLNKREDHLISEEEEK
ncbi:MAG: hypothetical protein E6K54_05585 [Gammaproteobacteria bacterium]|nr:MAG: hypothetical protein E6K54_05585 [Gammaproteobacteria bacterium]